MTESTSYTLDENSGYVVITLHNPLNYSGWKSFQDELDEVAVKKSLHSVIDCSNINIIPNDWVRTIMRLQLLLKKESKIVRLVNVNQNLRESIKREGIDTSLKASKDLKEVLVELGITPKKPALDTEFINPFLSAAIHVLKVQAQVDATAGKVQLKKPEETSFGDISGIIGIVSKTFDGSVVISFPEETFLKVMSGMLGETYTEINKDIIDGAGEITNMIFGQAKIVLNERGYGINTAIPSVISGKNHSLSSLTKGPVIVVPFESNVGKFFVEICLSK